MTEEPPKGRVAIRFVGNATMVLRYGSLTLLTDPNLLHGGRFVHLGYGLVSRRLLDPAVPLREIPRRPDAVILSHLHGDHWDRPARRHLDPRVPVLTTPHAARWLRRVHRFPRAVGLPTWHGRDLVARGARVRVTAVPGRHARGALRVLLPPVMGSVVEFGPATGGVDLRMYISGDTLPIESLGEVTERHPDIHLAVLHLGGTRLPGGFLVTMDGRLGNDLIELLDPPLVLPIHYEEYTVMKSPLADFLHEAERRGFAPRVVHCPRGGLLHAGPGARVEPVPGTFPAPPRPDPARGDRPER
ncbi:MBL fold metallo-hydrolase [Streptomyces calidiresistens]|uniref:MBL fold metallo-hydrolase n=1 Tax=Streptomyces calidiresistens TaxID=1485586 RepID=A0A7W3XX30_9ACTN|nr:MBL fold metallo-hydrolase [Streptomyces calidiresistens]MBB0230361.1 MBL fold metallo-hydrolase [Streptomyces calidiresistens]